MESTHSQTPRVGVIGVRGIGLGHAFALRTVDTADLAAVCDIDAALAEKTAADFEVPRVRRRVRAPGERRGRRGRDRDARGNAR